MKRRQFLQWLTGAGIAASGLIVPHRSIFLPPVGGWPHGRIDAIVSLIIPKRDIDMYWAEEIAAGRMAYDPATEVLSLLKMSDPSPPSVNTLTMCTPNEWVPNEALAMDEWGNFTRGGATPMRFVGRPLGPQYDAYEKAMREELIRQRRELFPSLPGDAETPFSSGTV